MAPPRQHTPVIRFAAIFSRHPSALEWATRRAEASWGNAWVQSPDLPFDATDYYERTMGQNLRKRLVAFERLIDPADLVDSKLLANEWERQFAEDAGVDELPADIPRDEVTEQRPLNIDPGYVSEAKVVLATMKDRDHRLYLGKQVFGEVTLYFQLPGIWKGSRWTYPDYLSPAYHEFFLECRARLREKFRLNNE